MDNRALNYDFAAKTPTGYTGVAASRGQGPTRSEIKRAHEQAVGGYRKRCRQGKVCSATCIAFNKDCLVHLPIPMQREVRRAAIYIARKQGLTPGSASDIRQGAALQSMAPGMKVSEGNKKQETVGGKKVTKPRLEFDRDQKRAERPRTTLEENLELIKRLPLLRGADRDETAKRIVQLDAMSRGIKLPRNELEAMYDLLPASTRTSLQNSGKATGRWYDGKDENGNDKFKTGDKGSRERGLAVFDMWMRQGGTDAYMGRGSKRFAPQDMDVEHIKTFGQGGKDAPSNWVLIRAGVNRKRAEQDLESFISRLPKTREEQIAYLKNVRKIDTLERIKNKAMENLDPKNFKDEDLLKPANLGLDQKKLSKMLGTYSNLRDWGTAADAAKGGDPGVRLQTGPPPMLRAGINFLAKNGVPEADAIAKQVKKIWNKDLIHNGTISPQQALNKMMAAITPHLTASQNQAVQGELEKWVKTNGKYGFSADVGSGEAPRKMNAMEAHLAKFR